MEANSTILADVDLLIKARQQLGSATDRLTQGRRILSGMEKALYSRPASSGVHIEVPAATIKFCLETLK